MCDYTRFDKYSSEISTHSIYLLVAKFLHLYSYRRPTTESSSTTIASSFRQALDWQVISTNYVYEVQQRVHSSHALHVHARDTCKNTMTSQHHSTHGTGTTRITITIAMGAKLQKDFANVRKKKDLAE